MKNVLMIDLETTGTRPGCCILSIGAAGIDKDGKEANFYCRISYGKSKEEGFDDEAGTLSWWIKQDSATREEAFGGTEEPEEVVSRFVAFVLSRFDTLAKDFTVWSKGSDFDFPILKAYLDAYDLNTPWPFWTQRDYRTLQAVFPFIKDAESNVEKHNAYEDARAQMRGLLNFMNLEAVFKEKPHKLTSANTAAVHGVALKVSLE